MYEIFFLVLSLPQFLPVTWALIDHMLLTGATMVTLILCVRHPSICEGSRGRLQSSVTTKRFPLRATSANHPRDFCPLYEKT
jgi:hypothetical protein